MAVITEEVLTTTANTLVSRHGSLEGEVFGNVCGSLKDILLNQDLNALLGLLADAHQAGYNEGFSCAEREMEENS